MADLQALGRQLGEERQRLQMFLLRARREAEDRRETTDRAAERCSEYFEPVPGESCGPAGRFEVLGELGKGVFATVYRCRDVETGVEHAVKFVRSNPMVRRAAEKEIRLMGRICKELAVRDPDGARCLLGLAFFEGFEHRGHLALVFELMRCDLREGLSKYGEGGGLPLSPALKNFSRQLFCALRALHGMGVIHCDVKPENLLLSQDKASVKLADFGAAMDMSERIRTDYMQPRFYRAPEVILGQEYTTQVDIWSSGVTLFELATGRAPFDGATNNEMVHQMLKLRGAFPRDFVAFGEFAPKHFNRVGEFMNASGDYAVNSSNPAVLPMSRFPAPRSPSLRPLLQAAVRGPPAGAPPGRWEGHVQHFAALLEGCLEVDPGRRLTPHAALAHGFFARSA